MSVKIDVDMPESCDDCTFGHYTGVVSGKNYIYACRILNCPVTINIKTWKRFKNCPLKEIK